MKRARPVRRRVWLALIAVVLGNVLYLAFQQQLPPPARHTPFRLDLGLIVDFWLCAVIFGLLLGFFRLKH